MAELLTSLDSIPRILRHGCALAVGNFDGVHRGHAALIRRLVKIANSIGGQAVVMTFDPPPQELLFPDRPATAPLSPIKRRAELLGDLGVSALIAYPTNPSLLALSATEFFEQVVVGKLNAKAMIEGPNFRFGKDRAGDVVLLEQLCNENGLQLEVVTATSDSDGMISSTRVRALLAAGEISSVNAMLTKPYQIEGVVVDGAHRGRELGFPTANLSSVESMLPAHGVYAGSVKIADQIHPCAVNIGPNPTFSETSTKVEIHVIDWNGPLYGENIRCDLHSRIRGIEKFNSVEQLLAQISKDIVDCKKLVLTQ